MDKDYKLIAGLIPIILILSLTMYLFPESNGLTTIQVPIINQTNQSGAVNTTTSNSSAGVTQPASITAQNSQSSSSSSSNYYPSNTNTNTGNGSDFPTTPETPTETGNGTPYII